MQEKQQNQEAKSRTIQQTANTDSDEALEPGQHPGLSPDGDKKFIVPVSSVVWDDPELQKAWEDLHSQDTSKGQEQGKPPERQQEQGKQAPKASQA